MKNKKTSVTFPEDLHSRFKSVCVDRNISMSEAYLLALQSWIDGSTYSPPPNTPYSNAELKRFKGVSRIMKSGNPDLIDALTDAIEELARRI